MFDSLDAQHPAPTAGLGNLLLLLQLLLQLLQHICTPASSLLLLVMHDMLRGCCTKVDVFNAKSHLQGFAVVLGHD